MQRAGVSKKLTACTMLDNSTKIAAVVLFVDLTIPRHAAIQSSPPSYSHVTRHPKSWRLAYLCEKSCPLSSVLAIYFQVSGMKNLMKSSHQELSLEIRIERSTTVTMCSTAMRACYRA